jgi:peptidoglycan/LPS O-acetylase OafA/YrhL
MAKYRPEIDGLRAVAVAPVILFHAGFSLFQGGYVGVDVFFVISGYLITTIIADEIACNDFSIIRFYERRARRILPALFLVVLVSIPFGWSWMLAPQLENFAESIVAVILFSSNFLFWRESGYFAEVVELIPLLHTWSLAVEEQFYVLFPLFLLLLRRLSLKTTLAAMAAVVVVSLGLAQWGTHAKPTAAFFLLPTRAWELGIGALLALTSSYWGRVHGAWSEAGSLLGLGLVAYAVFSFTRATPVPGIAGLAPVLGAAAIIAFAHPSTMVGRLLTLPPVVQLGLISYSAYLWHQPIFVLARLRHFSGELPPIAYSGLIVLTLVLAYASWKLVEQPFRKDPRITRAHVFSAGVLVAVALGCFGATVSLAGGAPSRFPEVTAFAHWLRDMSPYRDTCGNADGTENIDSPSCLHGPADAEPLELWADSHGLEIAWQLSEKLAPLGVGVHEMTHHACMPINDYRAGETPGCIAFRKKVFERLTSGQSRAPVVLVARWSVVFDPTPFNNREGGIEKFRPEYLTTEQTERRSELLRSTIQTLLDRGRRVVVIYPIPEVGWNVPRFLMGERIFGQALRHPMSTSYQVYLDRAGPAISRLDGVPDHPNLIRIRPSDLLCDKALRGRCVAEVDGRPLYVDDNHLNSVGAAMVADAIVAAMEQKGWLSSSSDRPSR